MNSNGKDIVSAIRKNPEKGFRLLMSEYGEAIYWHIRRLVVLHDDAQDAAQETFVRVFRSIGNTMEGRSFTAWIYRIATNEALRLLSRRETERQLLEKAGRECPMMTDGHVDYSDLEAVKLQRAILSLPRKQQVTFNLRYYDGLSYDEIAEATESTAAGAKANYHAAKEKIIRYMNEND